MIKFFLILCTLFSLSLLNASDEKQGRYYASLSGGFGYENITFENNGIEMINKNYFTSSANIKVGYEFNKKISAFFTRENNFFDAPFIENETTVDKIYLLGMTGVGVSYSFSRDTDFFISSTIALAELQTLGYSNADFGIGSTLSCGYRWRDNIFIELVLYSISDIQSKNIDTLHALTTSTQVHIGYTFY